VITTRAGWLSCVTLALVTAGCFEGIREVGPGDAAPQPDAGQGTEGGTPDAGLPLPDATTPDAITLDAGDPTAALFDPTHIVEVRIDLPPGDWDQLRQQTRGIFDVLTGDCLAAPFPSPFTTFVGTVSIDGKTLQSVGVRKKGFIGSLSTEKPSLKLKFDDTIAGQNVSGADGMTLNNAKQDPAFVRQCLGYAAFARAGIPASRCNFAHVVVNGADLGLYVHVEGIDKDLLRRHFPDATGNLYEGTLSDFDATFLATFDLKTNEVANDRSDLGAVADALTAPDAQLLTRLDPLVNLNEFFDYWAMETVVRQWDGYANNTNNFFLYHDPPSGRFTFLPWGIDGIMDPAPVASDGNKPAVVITKAELTRRLYAIQTTRDRYLGRVRALLDVAFKESDILAEIDRMQRLILPVVATADATKVRAAIDGVRTFVRTRRQAILAELAAPPVGATAPKAAPCMKPIGTISGTFSTKWDTLAAVNPFAAGSATLTATVNGMPLPIDLVGSTAGLDITGMDGPRAAVNVVFRLTDGTFGAAILRTVPSAYAANVTLPFDLGATFGAVAKFQGTTSTPIGLMGKGSLSLTAAGATTGATVTGSFTADLMTWPF
jgi:CotH kinase protein